MSTGGGGSDARPAASPDGGAPADAPQPKDGGGSNNTGKDAKPSDDAETPPPPPPPDEELPACKTTKEIAAGADIGAALATATPGTCIVAADGDYKGFTTTQKGTADAPIVVRAKNRLKARITSGETKLNGAAHVVLEGFTVNADVRIDAGCLHCRITRCKFDVKSSEAWIYIERAETKYTRIDHSEFGPKADPGNFIKMAYASMPQYTRIDHNHFRDNGPAVTNGKEALRLGWSGVSMQKGFTTVEYNLFTNCDGDPEIISVKSCNAVVRYNTVRSSAGVLSLRHGNDSEVYGNFIFGDGVKAKQGGIRVYGQRHRIYNNYIANTTGTANSAPLVLHGGDVKAGGELNRHHQNVEVQMVNNTLVDNAYGIEVGKTYTEHPPEKCLVANNLIVRTKNAPLLEAAALSVTYANNMFIGGTPMGNFTEAQLRQTDPALVKDGELHRLASGSPAIDSAMSIEYVKTDFEGQPRAQLDIGADELSSAAKTARPLTEADVGPNAP